MRISLVVAVNLPFGTDDEDDYKHDDDQKMEDCEIEQPRQLPRKGILPRCGIVLLVLLVLAILLGIVGGFFLRGDNRDSSIEVMPQDKGNPRDTPFAARDTLFAAAGLTVFEKALIDTNLWHQIETKVQANMTVTILAPLVSSFEQ